MRIVTLAQWTLAAGVVAGTLLQFVGALYVREYAKGLRLKEIREERLLGAAMAGERWALSASAERGMGGLEVIDEEEDVCQELVKL
jgi:hypothetical protein